MGSYFPGSPVVKISPPNGWGVGSIPAWGDKMPQGGISCMPHRKKQNKTKQNKYYNKFNKDFKRDPHPKKSFKRTAHISNQPIPST